MDYKDAVGADINVGDHIVYSATDGRLQLGKVLELTISTSSYWVSSAPAIKIQGARRIGCGPKQGSYEKFGKVSKLFRLENVLVINNNLNAIVTLI